MTTNEDLAMTLQQIMAKLTNIERFVSGPSAKVARSSEEAVLREKLDRLTIKRHAVLTATLGDVGYQALANTMECDVTTVKLHLKSALTLLDVPTRSILLANHKGILDAIPEKEYEQRYGIGKKWWLEQKPALMLVLRSTKAAANQHTTPK